MNSMTKTTNPGSTFFIVSSAIDLLMERTALFKKIEDTEEGSTFSGTYWSSEYGEEEAELISISCSIPEVSQESPSVAKVEIYCDDPDKDGHILKVKASVDVDEDSISKFFNEFGVSIVSLLDMVFMKRKNLPTKPPLHEDSELGPSQA